MTDWDARFAARGLGLRTIPVRDPAGGVMWTAYALDRGVPVGEGAVGATDDEAAEALYREHCDNG